MVGWGSEVGPGKMRPSKDMTESRVPRRAALAQSLVGILETPDHCLRQGARELEDCSPMFSVFVKGLALRAYTFPGCLSRDAGAGCLE